MADHNNPQSRDEEILIATIDRTEYNKLPQSRMEELLLELKETIEEGGGGGGTTNYNNLSNQPQVNGETLIGDKSGSDLGLVDAEEGKCLSTNDYDDKEKAAVAAATLAIAAMKDGSELDSFGDVEVSLLDKADVSDLGTAAAKDSTNSVTSGSTDLVESGAVKDAIDAAVAAAYHHAGTKTVAQLTHDLLIAANEGNVYNITDSGTTTSDFIEGIGKTIDEGSNVGICKVGNVYMFDLLSGFVDTTNFVQKSQTAGLLNNDGTVNTTIEDDIDSLKSGLTNLDNEVNGDATVYPYADVITIEDAVPSNLANCKVKIEPVQDLHGFDHPWVGGAGKNIIPLTVSGIKSFNTSGTWTGNVYSVNGVTLELLTDSDNNVTGVKLNGSNNSGTAFDLIFYYGNMSNMVSIGGTYTVTGCTVTDGRTHEYSGTFTIDSDWYINAGFIKIYVGATKSFDNEIRYPKLEVGNQATTFAPYTNYCPITGHTEASVQRDGKNKFNVNGSYINRQDANGTYTISGNSITVTASTMRVAYAGFIVPLEVGETYTLSYTSTGIIKTIQIDDPISVIIDGYYGTNTYSGTSFVADKPYILINCSGDTVGITFSNIQLELGSSATDYEPFKGKTYTIALGDTIYGGTVRIDSNGNTVMDVDRAVKVFNGSNNEGWNESSGVMYATVSDALFESGKKTIVTNMYKTIADTTAWNLSDGQTTISKAGNDSVILVNDAVANDLSTFKAFLANNNLQAVYKLATPFTVQLTPQQIQLLKGQNTLTASTGQISVTVNGVSGAIGSLQTQATATDAALAELAADVSNLQSSVTALSKGTFRLFTIIDSAGLAVVSLPKATTYTVGAVSAVGLYNIPKDDTDGYSISGNYPEYGFIVLTINGTYKDDCKGRTIDISVTVA